MPKRVRARQRGACASRAGSGCMGLFGGLSIFATPGMIVELIGNHRLPALVDVIVFDGLDVSRRQPVQRFDCGAALRLRLQAKPQVCLPCGYAPRRR